MTPMNPTGKHRAKRRHHGEGTVVRRADHWRAKPWAAVIPYLDESGRPRKMWLSAGSRDEADDLRKRELARIRKGIRPTYETVGQFMSSWLETVEVGPGTWPRYRQHLTERIMPSFGDVALDRLTPQMVRRAVIDWTGSPQTRSGTLRLLRAGMRQAVADRRIEHDPTAGIPHPRTPTHNPVTLTGPEARKLMATVKGERFAPILVLSLGLGVRRGEALGLRTKDIHLGNEDDWIRDTWDQEVKRHRPEECYPCRGSRTYNLPLGAPDDGREDEKSCYCDCHTTGIVYGSVTIAKSLRYIAPSMRAEKEGPYRLTGTKSDETREVPLPRFVADALRERLAEREREKNAAKVWAANDLVFCTPVGNNIALETLRTWYLGALKRAELAPIRWHDLRATSATLLIDAGVDLLTLQTILGHHDLATTRRYVGKTPAAMRAAAGTMDEAIGDG